LSSCGSVAEVLGPGQIGELARAVDVTDVTRLGLGVLGDHGHLREVLVEERPDGARLRRAGGLRLELAQLPYGAVGPGFVGLHDSGVRQLELRVRDVLPASRVPAVDPDGIAPAVPRRAHRRNDHVLAWKVVADALALGVPPPPAPAPFRSLSAEHPTRPAANASESRATAAFGVSTIRLPRSTSESSVREHVTRRQLSDTRCDGTGRCAPEHDNGPRPTSLVGGRVACSQRGGGGI
jgi:hypothetical protein